MGLESNTPLLPPGSVPGGCADRRLHTGLGEQGRLGDCGPTHTSTQTLELTSPGGGLQHVSSRCPLLHDLSVPLIPKSLTVQSPHSRTKPPNL